MSIQKMKDERTIESHLRHYLTYKTGIVNCQKQLDYIMPNMTAHYDFVGGSTFHISNSTEKVAIDRIESKRALDLHETIQRYLLIVQSIENALGDLKNQEREFIEHRYFNCMSIQEVKLVMGYSEEKSIYRIRRHALDKLLISLNNLLSLK